MTTCTTQPEQPSNPDVAANDQHPSGILDFILVTYDTRVDKKKGSKASLVSLSFVVDEIRSSEDLQKKVEIVRAAPTDDERRELKRRLLPYFTFLHFTDGVRQSESFEDVHFMLMDWMTYPLRSLIFFGNNCD